MICGIATFGLLTGILATGFAAERRRRNFIQTWDLVSKVPFFQSLDPAAITEITHMLRRLEVSERTVMIRRGKIGDCMYFIADGEVQVDVSPNPVRFGSARARSSASSPCSAIRCGPPTSRRRRLRPSSCSTSPTFAP